jgi:molybdenum cofactor cytidylyltransferase
VILPGGHNVVILAAGGSARLGQAKQLLRRDGETLVARMVRLAEATRPTRLMMVVGAQADAVIAAVHDPHLEVLINPQWQEGLASSLRYAACALARESAPTMILGCDQVALELPHLLRLIDGYAARGCAVTRLGDVRGLPVMVPAEVLSRALDLSGDVGLRAVLRERAHVFELDAPELALDVDTAEDVALARERRWLD